MIKPDVMQATGSLTEMPCPCAFFTICSKNFLAHAKTLYQSVQPHYPNSRFFTVLCDRVDGCFDPTSEPFEFVFIEDLALPNFAEMVTRYNITELNTAVKPFAFMHLMEHFGLDSVVYLDPDIFVIDRMSELERLIVEGAEAVLTPHILRPAENDEVHDGKMLQFGIYNLGFLALRNTPDVKVFLQWWGRRLERHCIIKLEDGLFVDQKWADLLPAFVPGTRILNHPGYNVAYWNLPQRKIVRKAERWFANGQPLRFVHFSGNKLEDESFFSRHSRQVTIDSIGDLREILSVYRQEIYCQGHTFYRSLPYAYSWGGETGVNLHTPEEFNLANCNAIVQDIVVNSAVSEGSFSVGYLKQIKRRFFVVRRAMPIAKNLSGGVAPLFRRIWHSYRRNGWHHVKTKIVELSHYTAPEKLKDCQSQVVVGRSDKPMRLLYLDWAIPKPDQDAASVTAALLLRIFDSNGYLVTFIPCSLKYENGYYEDLISANINVLVYPEIQSVNDWLKTNAKEFDVCVMARGPVVWPYLETLKIYAPNLRLIFNTVDLHYLRELRQADLLNDNAARQAAFAIKDQEIDLIDKCDLTILLSSDELYEVREIMREASLVVLPIVFNDIPGAINEYEQRKDLVFIGSFLHKPNVDAVIYFAEAIFPIVRSLIPDIRFKIVGANPPEEIKCLGDVSGIDVLGYVRNLDQLLSGARLTVAPLRYGAGIKGKIGSSLCYGVPCVATPIAVEGMGLSVGRNVLVGSTPEEFANAVCRAYLDAGLWNVLSREGHRFAHENYSVEVISDRIMKMLFAVTNDWPVIHNSIEFDGWESFCRHSVKMEKEYEKRVACEQSLLPTDGSDSFWTTGFCNVCGKRTRFLTSFMYSTGETCDGRSMPNWREHMQCEHCGLVNRMRAAINVLHTYAPPEKDSSIYLTEKLTRTYHWFEDRYPNLQGSEYWGGAFEPGVVVNGIRHEDVMNLSFGDATFDRCLSFDVLEHVPDPYLAFQEFFRVLKPGGTLVFSVPFSCSSQPDVVRAIFCEDGSIVNCMPAEYHGNPVDPESGALCFRYFGWDMLERVKMIGFEKVVAIAYWSEVQGYLGREQFLFLAEKSALRDDGLGAEGMNYSSSSTQQSA